MLKSLLCGDLMTTDKENSTTTTSVISNLKNTLRSDLLTHSKLVQHGNRHIVLNNLSAQKNVFLPNQRIWCQDGHNLNMDKLIFRHEE